MVCGFVFLFALLYASNTNLLIFYSAVTLRTIVCAITPAATMHPSADLPQILAARLQLHI